MKPEDFPYYEGRFSETPTTTWDDKPLPHAKVRVMENMYRTSVAGIVYVKQDWTKPTTRRAAVFNGFVAVDYGAANTKTIPMTDELWSRLKPYKEFDEKVLRRQCDRCDNIVESTQAGHKIVVMRKKNLSDEEKLATAQDWATLPEYMEELNGNKARDWRVVEQGIKKSYFVCDACLPTNYRKCLHCGYSHQLLEGLAQYQHLRRFIEDWRATGFPGGSYTDIGGFVVEATERMESVVGQLTRAELCYPREEISNPRLLSLRKELTNLYSWRTTLNGEEEDYEQYIQ